MTLTAEQPPDKNIPLVTEAVKLGAVPDGYKEIEVKFHQWKAVGEFIKGRLLIKNFINGSKGKVGKYTVETETGKVAFLGSLILDELLQSAPLGSSIYIVYLGKTSLEGERDMNQFKVFIK